MRLTRVRIWGLVVMAAGAILAFAVHVHSPHLKVPIVGWVLIVVGAVIVALPARHRLTRWRRTPRLGTQPNAMSSLDVREEIEQQEEDLLREIVEGDEL